MMLASPAFSSGCRAHCLGGWWASRCGWGRPLSRKQIAVWRWWSGGLWVCSLWCPPSCCFPWRCLSSWHWDCLRTGQHPCHPGPRRVYTLEEGPLRPRTRDHAGTTSFYLIYNGTVPMGFLPRKFRLPSLGKASCDRVTLPKLRWMLGVLVFPQSIKLWHGQWDLSRAHRCKCMRLHMGVYGHRRRVCTESWLREKNPLPYRRIEPASAPCRSNALSTEPHLHPYYSTNNTKKSLKQMYP